MPRYLVVISRLNVKELEIEAESEAEASELAISGGVGDVLADYTTQESIESVQEIEKD